MPRVKHELDPMWTLATQVHRRLVFPKDQRIKPYTVTVTTHFAWDRACQGFTFGKSLTRDRPYGWQTVRPCEMTVAEDFLRLVSSTEFINQCMSGSGESQAGMHAVKGRSLITVRTVPRRVGSDLFLSGYQLWFYGPTGKPTRILLSTDMMASLRQNMAGKRRKEIRFSLQR